MTNYTAKPIQQSSHQLMGGPVPYEARQCQFDLALQNAQIADTIDLLPLNPTEHVAAAWLRIDGVGTASGTIAVTDTRNAGAILAATALDAALNTQTKAAGASVGVAGTIAQGSGTLRGTIAGAAMLVGKFTLYAIIGLGF